MASFYYNSFLKKSIGDQWAEHLTLNHYIKDGKDFINDKNNEMSDFIGYHIKTVNSNLVNLNKTNQQQYDAIKNGTASVCGTLEAGFDSLNKHLKETNFRLGSIHNAVSDMHSMIDDHLFNLILETKIQTVLLGNIVEILKIPEKQKERQYHVTQGLEFLQNAQRDDTFYPDALENFQKALEKEKTDFFTLHNLGIIFLYSPKYLNFTKARDYFLTSARYAVAKSNIGIKKNFLRSEGNAKNPIIQTVFDLKYQGAQAFLLASKTHYLQGDYSKAINLINEAIKLVPNYLEAKFHKAKYLSLNGNIAECCLIVEELLKQDRYYSIKIALDGDLIKQIEVQRTINKLISILKSQNTNRLNNANNNLIKNSKGKDLVNSIKSLIRKSNYISLRDAKDLLDKKNNYTFNKWADISNESITIYENKHLINLYANNRPKIGLFDIPFQKKFQFNIEELTKNEFEFNNVFIKHIAIKDNLLKEIELTRYLNGKNAEINPFRHGITDEEKSNYLELFKSIGIFIASYFVIVQPFNLGWFVNILLFFAKIFFFFLLIYGVLAIFWLFQPTMDLAKWLKAKFIYLRSSGDMSSVSEELKKLQFMLNNYRI